jgi:hypothetical protein
MNILAIQSVMQASDPSNLPSVCKAPHTRFGNGWKVDTAPGKKLTNHAITKREKEGYYGEARKIAALNRAKPASDFIDRCKCGETKGVKHYSYQYLPEPAFLCPACLERARGFRVKIKSAGMAKRDLNEFV